MTTKLGFRLLNERRERQFFFFFLFCFFARMNSEMSLKKEKPKALRESFISGDMSLGRGNYCRCQFLHSKEFVYWFLDQIPKWLLQTIDLKKFHRLRTGDYIGESNHQNQTLGKGIHHDSNESTWHGKRDIDGMNFLIRIWQRVYLKMVTVCHCSKHDNKHCHYSKSESRSNRNPIDENVSHHNY